MKEHTSFVQRHIIMQHIQNMQLRDISQGDALKIKGRTKFLGVHKDKVNVQKYVKKRLC